MTKNLLRRGQTVVVAPWNPLAIGRGVGEVVHVGPEGKLVLVKFPGIKGRSQDGGVACFASDCKVLESAAIHE